MLRKKGNKRVMLEGNFLPQIFPSIERANREVGGPQIVSIISNDRADEKGFEVHSDVKMN